MYNLGKLKPALTIIKDEFVDRGYELLYGVPAIGGVFGLASGKEELQLLGAGLVLYGIAGFTVLEPMRYKMKKAKENSKRE